MKYGKIRIEDGNFIFSKHMMMNYLPCKDIIWAYKRKEGVEGGAQKQYSTSSLVIITRRKKRYQFEMTDREIQNCIQLMRALNPQMVTGFPQGSRIPMQSLPNTRDLGALETEDGRHILPKRLLRSGSLYHISITDQDMLTHEYLRLWISEPGWNVWKSRIPLWKVCNIMRFRSLMRKRWELPDQEARQNF